jgi:uncharacterized protein YdhG (YjbR/CyaY superfamily)
VKAPAGRTDAKQARGGGAVGAYLASLRPKDRAALARLCRVIKAVAPGGIEVFRYRIPIYQHRGKLLVGYAAFPNHCSLFVMSTRVMREHATDLERYDTSKGTIHFSPGKSLPVGLVRKLVKARIAENQRGSRG